MSGKYGFSGGIDLPKTTPAPKPRPKVDGSSLSQAVKAGADLGFVSREPTTRLKPGPKRIVDDFRAFCSSRNLTLWQGLELLLEEQKGRGG